MCPACMATAAVTITSATSAGGGFAALVVKIFRRRNIARKLPELAEKEGNHGK